jgi:hypothetical protein
MATPNEEPDEGKLQEVQDTIDEARDRARDHGMAPETDEQEEERDVEQHEEEEAIDGLTRPGLG